MHQERGRVVAIGSREIALDFLENRKRVGLADSGSGCPGGLELMLPPERVSTQGTRTALAATTASLCLPLDPLGGPHP